MMITENGKMDIYGDKLIDMGIVLLLAAAVLGAVFFGIHAVLSSRLRKILEKEYGKEKKGGD